MKAILTALSPDCGKGGGGMLNELTWNMEWDKLLVVHFHYVLRIGAVFGIFLFGVSNKFCHSE
jgi:hypothetical protein